MNDCWNVIDWFHPIGIGTLLGDSGWCQCLSPIVGHVWWSWKGSTLCLWKVRVSWGRGWVAWDLVTVWWLVYKQIRCGVVVLLDSQPSVTTQLYHHLVSRDTQVLPTYANSVGWLQKWPSVHVSWWKVSNFVPWTKSFLQVTNSPSCGFLSCLLAWNLYSGFNHTHTRRIPQMQSLKTLWSKKTKYFMFIGLIIFAADFQSLEGIFCSSLLFSFSLAILG